MINNISDTPNFEKIKSFFFILLGISIFLVSNNNGMFWDNVLFASKMGNHLYYNSVFNWTIPNEFDPGHPPFLGFLLAISWKALGHKLWVSHLLMLPFIIGVFHQLYKLITYFVTHRKHQILAFLLIIIDPTFSTQLVLVNPEVIIVFFFLLTYNGILFKNNKFKFIGLFFLSIVSFRSMMLLGGLFLYDILNKLYVEKKTIKSIFNLKFLVFYFLGSLPGITFVIWRLLTKGWLQTHPDSPWASLWKVATPKIFIKNSITLIHRYLDFGRVFMLLFLFVSLFVFGRKIIKSTKNKQLLLLSIASVFFIIIAVLFSTNAFGHRYFIVSIICLNLLTFRVIQKNYTKKKLIYGLLFFGLITGNLWIYPKNVSQGWDATLAHVPYHSLRIKAIDYLKKEQVDVSKVASFFPNLTTLDFVDFSGDKKSFTKFTGNNKYVINSTVYNLSDEELNILDKNYTILKEFKKLNITITIYILDKK